MTEQEKREKVIRGLECCTKDECECCPYENVCFGDDEVEIFDTLARDALALLKAQEPVEPLHLHDQSKLPIKCGNCGAFIIIFNKPFGFGDYKAKYCCECGRAVKWE